MQLKPGTLLQGGKYRILNAAEVLPMHENVELGQGGFGITYLAEHTTLGKKVCIKEFFMKELNLRTEDGSITGLSEGTLSYNYAQKFRKEAINLAGMEHPNIVRVTDSFDENGTFYYVMDYIDGKNLNEYIKDHVLSESEAISIIKDVANALMYMHEQKHMLHLDLKPGNIMRRASDGHIFLIDFGLSKHYDKNGTPETSTTIGGGTPCYAPTEQGDKAKDGEFRPTIDVYALGATLFKLLTRETPPTASEVVNDDEFLAEKLSNKRVSQNVINLVVKAMKPGYKKRIQTMREFISALPGSTESFNSKQNYHTSPVDSDETIVTNSSNTPPNAKGFRENVYGNQNHHTIPVDNEETIVTNSSNTPPNAKGFRENVYGNGCQKKETVETLTEETNYEGEKVACNTINNSKSNKILLWVAIGIVAIVVFMTAFYAESNQSNGSTNQRTSKVDKPNVNQKDITSVKATYSNGILNVDGIIYDMVAVKGATFTMGRTPEQHLKQSLIKETPSHQVTLSDYRIGKTVVTQALWKAIMGNNPSRHKGNNHPVENLSFQDCLEFISRLNSLTGKRFRLPTEAEWEFAARGGIKSRHYQFSGSNNLDDVAWYEENSGGTTHDVGTKQPNELGIYDMSGNIEEWCSGWVGDYSRKPQNNPKGPEKGAIHPVRGGHFDTEADYCRTPSRNGYWDDKKDPYIGLRLTLSE